MNRRAENSPEMTVLARSLGFAAVSEAQSVDFRLIKPDFLAPNSIGAELMRNPG